MAEHFEVLEALDRSHAIVEFSVDGRIISANNNFLKCLGYSLEEIKGRHHSLFVDVECRDSGAYRAFWDRLARGECESGKFKRISKDGSEVWVEASYTPVVDLNGRVTKVIKIAQDISKDISEQRLKYQEFDKKMGAIYKQQEVISAGLAVIEFEMDGTIISANENFLRIMGYSLVEIQGKHHSKFVHPEFRASKEYKAFWQKLNDGELHTGEFERVAKDGKPCFLQASYNPIFDMDGKLVKVIKYASDVTSRKLELRRSQKESEDANAYLNRQNKHRENIQKLFNAVRGEQTAIELCSNVLSRLSDIINVQIGAFYQFSNDRLHMLASYAYTKRKNLSNEFALGEGIVGQCAIEKKIIIISNVSDDYIKICSGLGEITPSTIMVIPIILESHLLGILEIAKIGSFIDDDIKFIEESRENIAIAFKSSIDREKMKALLEQTRLQAQVLQEQQEELRVTNEELQQQQEHLRATNEELEHQAQQLKESEENIKRKNEELKITAERLEKQKKEISDKNVLVEMAKRDIELKAQDLALASKYKTEFLANMSHELRTPLNSLLILSEFLAANEDGNLTAEQVESAKIINEGGKDLLTLINDILDLSKVEAGKLEIHIEKMPIAHFIDDLKKQFEPIAKKKGLIFDTKIEADVPFELETDKKRVEQIVRNFLSNAFKFTSDGFVKIIAHCAPVQTRFFHPELTTKNCIGLSVIDTGIGIPKNKQEAIFEAFQQADGSTSRKYGGTGLGLSISKELAKCLRSEIHLHSEEGQGSTFTVYVPLRMDGLLTINSNNKKAEEILPNNNFKPIINNDIEDDRTCIVEGDKSLLIIEDDMDFAKVIMKAARARSYKCLVANTGNSGLLFADEYKPSAITLDMNLPDMAGMYVLEQLKHNNTTRHIPVHIISASEESFFTAHKGAIGHLTKPASKEELSDLIAKFEITKSTSIKKVLVAEDDASNQKAIANLIENKNISLKLTSSGKEAYQEIISNNFDCVILDVNLPDMSGFDVLEKLSQIESYNLPPIIIYTARELNKEEYANLRKYTSAIVVKGTESSERLLEELHLFLHSVDSSLPDYQKDVRNVLHEPAHLLKNRKVLVVDDDMRNAYAITAALRKKGIKVEIADNGLSAIDKLQSIADIDIVIMDIMMPIMDGYEAIKKIRTLAQFTHLPIIALTAKVMPEDKAKALECGANDFLTKPLDIEKLISLMQLWLFKSTDTIFSNKPMVLSA